MKALTTAASGIRHATGVALEAILLLAILIAVAFGAAMALGHGPEGAGSVLAARGGSGATSSPVWVAERAGVTARLAPLQYGSPFTVGYSSKEREPWAHATCYPNDSTVYSFTYADGSIWGEYFSVYDGGPLPQAFELIDPIARNWTSGGASCQVSLVKFSGDYSRETVLVTSTFEVGS